MPIGDFKIKHLSDDEQADLLSVLKRHNVWPASEKLGITHIVEHPIDVQGAQPVCQRPYRVPETKRRIIAQEDAAFESHPAIRKSVGQSSRVDRETERGVSFLRGL